MELCLAQLKLSVHLLVFLQSEMLLLEMAGSKAPKQDIGRTHMSLTPCLHICNVPDESQFLGAETSNSVNVYATG